MTGLAILTYKRPDYFKQCLDHILKNVHSIDYLFIYNDGSPREGYEEIYQSIDASKYPFYITVIHPEQNCGVAHAKNTVVSKMLQVGCDHLFTIEDDILVLDDKAVTEYIRIAQITGYEHFMFAHHGAGNASGAVYQDVYMAYYPSAIGAYCYYTRHCLDELKRLEQQKTTASGQPYPYPGLFDENFINAWEHVEHTKRLGDAGFTAMFGSFVDILDSRSYLKEIPGSIDYSSIRPRDDWKENQNKGMDYWISKDGKGIPVVYK